MQGVREMFGDAEIPVLALEAGVDQLLMPPDFPLAFNAVLDAVRSGRISEERIDQSVRRVLAQKWKRGVIAHPLVDESKVASRVGTPQNLATVQALTDRTTTVLRNDEGLLPLANPGRVLVVGVGDTVNQGQPILVMEAMKMQHTIAAPYDGTVTELAATAGQQVEAGTVLAVVTPAPEAADEAEEEGTD